MFTRDPTSVHTCGNDQPERNALANELAMAAAHQHWPACEYRPGHPIPANEDNWRRFLMHAPVEHLEEVHAKLREMAEATA